MEDIGSSSSPQPACNSQEVLDRIDRLISSNAAILDVPSIKVPKLSKRAQSRMQRDQIVNRIDSVIALNQRILNNAQAYRPDRTHLGYERIKAGASTSALPSLPGMFTPPQQVQTQPQQQQQQQQQQQAARKPPQQPMIKEEPLPIYELIFEPGGEGDSVVVSQQADYGEGIPENLFIELAEGDELSSELINELLNSGARCERCNLLLKSNEHLLQHIMQAHADQET